MKGWRITPLGWLLLAALVVLAIYYVIRWFRRPRNQGSLTDNEPLGH